MAGTPSTAKTAIEPGAVRSQGRAIAWARRASLALWLLAPMAAARWSTSVDVTGAPFSVGLFGVEILDPTAVLGVVVAGGASRALLWSGPIALFFVVVLGRFFCGWVCPYAIVLALSDKTRAGLQLVGLSPKNVAVPKLGLWVLGALLVVTAATGAQVLPLVYPPSVLSRAALQLGASGVVSGGVVVIALGFVLDTFVSRAAVCRTLCPGGAVFSLLGRASPVDVVRDPPKCTDCTICDVVCPAGLSPMTDRTGASCDRCSRCVDACPTDALALVPIARRKRSAP